LYNYNFPIDLSKRKPFVDRYEYSLNEYEPVFDAADILRCGKDLFVQKGYTTNDMGIDWIDREFSQKGFRVHRMLFENNFSPTHSDAQLTFLRPGLILSCPDRPIHTKLMKQIKDDENDWEIIEAPRPSTNKMPPNCHSSPWLSINILSIDENTVIVEKKEKELINLLSNEHGFNVIPLNFRDAYMFGGGFHCQTLDINRDGNNKSYFPLFDRMSDK